MGSADVPVRILHLEDSPLDAALIESTIEAADDRLCVSIRLVDRKELYLAALKEGGFDLILCDYRLPGYDGVQALAAAREMVPDVPVIMVTGEMGEERAIETLKLGAADYVLKDNLKRLTSAIRRALKDAAFERQERQTEARYRALVETSPEGIFINQNDTIQFINPAGARLLGAARPEELLGKPILDIFHPEYHALIRQRVRDIQVAGKPAPLIEEKMLRIDGSILEVETTAAGIMYEDKPAVQVIFRDITERREAQAALREREDRLQEMIRLAPSFVYEIDFHGPRFTAVNEAMCAFAGMSREEMLQTNPFDFLTDQSKAIFRQRIEQWLRKEEPQGFVEYEVKLRDGRKMWVVLNVTFTADADGTPKGATVIGYDITERKRAVTQMANDLAALTRMHELSSKLLDASGMQRLLQDIIDAAVALVGAQKGTLQLIEGDSLKIRAHSGHQQPFLEFFAAAEQVASACGEATRAGKRVIIPDVEESPLFADTPSLEILRSAGVRAVQSTPILTRGGKLLGILTTHWPVPHMPDTHDLWRMDLLVRQTADLIEIAQGKEVLQQREHEIAAILDSIQDPFYVVDGEWRVVYANAKVLELWSKTLEEVRGRGIFDLFPDITKYPSYHRLQEAMRERTSVTFESWSVSTNRWVEVRAYPTSGGGLNVIFSDITERRSVQERIEDIARFPEENPFPVFRMDAAGKLLYANPVAGALLASLGARIGEQVPPPFAELSARTWDQHKSQSAEVVLDRKLFLFVTKALTERGYVNIYGADITQQRRAEEDLRKLNQDLEARVARRTEQLEQLNAELESFSYTVAHDLKAPLRAVDMYATLMGEAKAQQPHGKRQEEYLQLIRSSSDRMRMLIESLLFFARTARQVPQRTTVNMRELAEAALREQCHLLGGSAARVKVTIGELPPAPKSDPVLLRLVFTNLLSNAFKFTRKTEEPRIEVGGYPRDGWLVYYVRDNGSGFPADQAGKLFQVFKRLHVDKEFEGTGVGLATVRKIIERHGGEVRAEGEEGKGATFSFTLPRE